MNEPHTSEVVGGRRAASQQKARRGGKQPRQHHCSSIESLQVIETQTKFARKNSSSDQHRNFRRDVRYYSNPDARMIGKAAFNRIVREIAPPSFRFTRESLELLQEAGESHAVHCLTGANLCARHRRRQTVGWKDMNLFRTLTGQPPDSWAIRPHVREKSPKPKTRAEEIQDNKSLQSLAYAQMSEADKAKIRAKLHPVTTGITDRIVSGTKEIARTKSL